MRATLTTLAALALVALPASSQITGTISRERTVLIRAVFLGSVSPATARRGQQNVTVTLTGLNTHFSQGVTTLGMGSGITVVSPVTVMSPTSANAVISVDAGTTAGARAVTVTSGAEVVSMNDGFTVLENPDYFGKVCNSATQLGTLQKGMSKQAIGLLDMAVVEDWFAISVPAATSLKLTLSGVGTGSEFEVSTFSSCGVPGVSTAAGVSPKQLILPAGQAVTYLIRISASHWNAASPRFTLTAVAE